MKILQLSTGLFPDAARVQDAVGTLDGAHDVTRIDVTGLAQDDEDGWGAVATAVLSTDLVVTL